MRTTTFALLLLALALALAGVAARAEERTPWRLGEPEIVWRDSRLLDSDDVPIDSLAVHPRDGFLLVSHLHGRRFRVRRFAADWRELWSTDIAWQGAGPWLGVQFAHVAILPSDHIVLSLTQALALLNPDGTLAWIRGAGRGQVERFAGFDGFGAVVASGDAFVLGGYGFGVPRNEPRCWSLQGMLARVGVDGRVGWRTSFRIPWRPGRSRSGGTPFAAAPLTARTDGSAIGYVAFGDLGTDMGAIATITHELQGEACRGHSAGYVIDIDRRGAARVLREAEASGSALGRRDSDLPLFAVIDPMPAGSAHVEDAELLWLGPHGQALYAAVAARLSREVMLQARVFPRAPPGIATIPVAAAARHGGDALVLVRRPVGTADDPEAARLETARQRSGSFRNFLLVVGARGVTLADERDMPPLRSVRLLPEQGIAYALVANTVVRFSLRVSAP